MNKHKAVNLAIAMGTSILVFMADAFGVELSIEAVIGMVAPIATYILGETMVDKVKIQEKSKSFSTILDNIHREISEAPINLEDEGDEQIP